MTLEKKEGSLHPQKPKTNPKEDEKKIAEKQKELDDTRQSLISLKGEVLNSLKIDFNGNEKYVKDVLYSNIAIDKIMEPKDVMKIQAFLKNKVDNSIEISGKYDKKTENAISIYKKEIPDFQDKYPKFRELIQKYPEKFEEIKKRALLYVELEKVKKEINFNQAIEKENISKVQEALSQNMNNNDFLSNKVTTKFEGWNNQGSINYNWTSEKKVTYAEYITILTNKNTLVNDLFPISTKLEVRDDKIKQDLSRAKIFLDSLIKINPKLNMDNKKAIDNIYSGNVDVNKIKDFIKKELNGLVVDFSTDEGLSKGLRSIGDTQTAGNIMQGKLLGEIENDTYKHKLEFNKNKNIYEVEFNEKKGIAYRRYNEIIKIMENDPTSEYYYLKNNEQKRNELKKGLIEMLALDETIKVVGTSGLGELGEDYKDMKGLGTFDFSDESVKMTKEMAIMITSMIVTAGAGALVGMAGAGLRVVQAARVAKAADTSTKVLRTGNLIVANGLSKTAKAFEISAKGIDRLNQLPILRKVMPALGKATPTLGSATVFTGADIALKGLFKTEGEMVTSLEDFSKNLLANSAMFGMFHGVGKITEGIISKLGINNAFAKFGVLSVGDVGGMYVLNLIETGNYDPTPEEWAKIATQVVGFRGVMKGIEKMYPRVYKKVDELGEFKKLNKKFKDGEIIIDKDGGFSRWSEKEQLWIKEKTLENTKTGIKDVVIQKKDLYIGYDGSQNPLRLSYDKNVRNIKLSEKGQQGDIIKDETGVHRWSEKQQGWISKGNGEVIKPLEKGYERKIVDDYGNEVVVKTTKDPKIIIDDYGNEVKVLDIISSSTVKKGYERKIVDNYGNEVVVKTTKDPKTIIDDYGNEVKVSDTINIPANIKTLEQARNWLEKNWKKLGIGAGVGIIVGGITYYFVNKEDVKKPLDFPATQEKPKDLGDKPKTPQTPETPTPNIVKVDSGTGTSSGNIERASEKKGTHEGKSEKTKTHKEKKLKDKKTVLSKKTSDSMKGFGELEAIQDKNLSGKKAVVIENLDIIDDNGKNIGKLKEKEMITLTGFTKEYNGKTFAEVEGLGFVYINGLFIALEKEPNVNDISKSKSNDDKVQVEGQKSNKLNEDVLNDNFFTPEQIKWLGQADRTDKYVLLRMPNITEEQMKIISVM